MVGPLIEASPGTVMLRVPGVARFLVRAGTPVLVEAVPGATDADIGCFRDGPVVAAAALLEGAIVLRAATVSIGGRGVVLCGASGTGKSSVAAALARRGHAVLADAVTTIACGVGGRFTVEPLAPELLLWPDSARQLGLDEAVGRSIRPALAKRAYRLGLEPVPSPVAAAAILCVDEGRSEPEVRSLRGRSKLEALLTASWHGRLIEALGLAAAQFSAIADLAAATPCVCIKRPRRGLQPAVLAELVEGLVE